MKYFLKWEKRFIVFWFIKFENRIIITCNNIYKAKKIYNQFVVMLIDRRKYNGEGWDLNMVFMNMGSGALFFC